MDNLKVAVIGAGSMARQHLQVLQSIPHVQIAAVSSRGAERLEKLAADFNIQLRFHSNEEMLENAKPDAVFVTVNASKVYEVASHCINYGVPALIEKPPGLTVAETEKLLKASRRIEAQYMLGLNRRFYSVMQASKGIVEQAGGLISVMVQYTENMPKVRTMNIHPPEVLQHWLAADGIHCIDLLRFFGGDVASVDALSSAWREATPNSYGALVRFEGGAIGHFISNWTSPGAWEVRLYGYKVRVDLCPLEQGTVTGSDGSVSGVQKDELDTKFKPGLYKQDYYFLDHVRNNLPIEKPAANLREAVDTMRLVEAIARSKVYRSPG